MKKLSVKLCAVTCLLILSIEQSYPQSPGTDRCRGRTFFIEAGGLTGVEKFKMYGGSLAFGGGYTFNKHFFLGMGANINALSIDDFDAASVPIFARAKYTLLKSKVTPYFSIDLGFDPVFINVDYDINPDYIPKESDIWIYGTKGGFYCRPELGVSWRLKKRKTINYGVGYSQQKGDFVRMKRTASNEIDSEQWNALDELTFRIGYTF